MCNEAMSTTTIEANLEELSVETEGSTTRLIEGSDDHLDAILRVTEILNRVTGKFERLNNTLHLELDGIPNDSIRDVLMPKFMDFNRSSLTLIGAVGTGKLYQSIRTAFKAYRAQYSLFHEMLYDLKHFRLNTDEEYDDLLDELNAM